MRLMLSAVFALPRMYPIRVSFFDALTMNEIVSFSTLFLHRTEVCQNSFQMTHHYGYIITAVLSSNQCRVSTCPRFIVLICVRAASGWEFKIWWQQWYDDFCFIVTGSMHLSSWTASAEWAEPDKGKTQWRTWRPQMVCCCKSTTENSGATVGNILAKTWYAAAVFYFSPLAV